MSQTLTALWALTPLMALGPPHCLTGFPLAYADVLAVSLLPKSQWHVNSPFHPA
jgi:hypothetical protein